MQQTAAGLTGGDADTVAGFRSLVRFQAGAHPLEAGEVVDPVYAPCEASCTPVTSPGTGGNNKSFAVEGRFAGALHAARQRRASRSCIQVLEPVAALPFASTA
jgi:hypothetical protein